MELASAVATASVQDAGAAAQPQAKAPRLLYLFDQYKGGGFETHLDTCLAELGRRGFRQSCLAGPDFSRSPQREHVREQGGLEVACFTPASLRAQVELIMAFCRQHAIEVAHAHPFLACVPAALAATLAGIPYLITFHGPPQPHNLAAHFGLFYLEALQRLVLPGAAAVTAVSEESAEAAASAFSLAPDRVQVVRNPIDLAAFAPGPGEAPAEPTALLVSRLDADREASCRAAMRLFSELRALASHWRFRVAGDGDAAARLRQFAGQLQLESIEWLGHRADVADLMRSTSVVTGLGRVMLEAMACGRWAVLASQEGLLGLIHPADFRALQPCNFSGRRGHPLEPAQVARAVQDAVGVEPPPSLIRLVAEDHDAARVASAYEGLYRAALRQQPAPARQAACREVLDWLAGLPEVSLRTLEWLGSGPPLPASVFGAPGESAAWQEAYRQGRLGPKAFEIEALQLSRWQSKAEESARRELDLRQRLAERSQQLDLAAQSARDWQARGAALRLRLKQTEALHRGAARQLRDELTSRSKGAFPRIDLSSKLRL